MQTNGRRERMTTTLQGMAVRAALYLSLLACVRADGTTNGFFSFVTTIVTVEERFFQPEFVVQRTGGTQGTVRVQCKINATHADDFYTGSTLEPFIVFGVGERSKTCRFTVYDDTIPEGNETFAVRLGILEGGGELSDPRTAQLIIVANDDGNGKIGFSSNTQVTATEPTSAGVVTPVKVLRLIGTYGDVTVKWKITSGPNNGADDFVTTSGEVSFADGQSEALLDLQVKPDNFAENEEFFTLTLESPTGGASLNTSFQQVQVLIPANDAPVRFPVQHIIATENMSSVNIEVHRGLGADGFTRIGPVSHQARVAYYLVSGNAKPGKDYLDRNGTVVFEVGERKKLISVNILDDAVPELAENFSVHLGNASSNTYVVPPAVAVVTILSSDDQHGVIQFAQSPKVLDEDGNSAGVFHVNRTAGTFGEVTVVWQVQGGNATVLSDTFDGSTGGVLRFLEGESSKSFNLNLRVDSIPEEAKEFVISLSNVTGGARLSNVAEERQAVFIVPDSDDVYGVVELAGEEQHKLQMSASPRQLVLRILRTGGMVGRISVSYTVSYYLPGASSPAPGVTLTYTSPAIIPAGYSGVNANVAVSDNQFIKVGSTFRVELSGVRLIGANLVTPAKTPKLGNQRTQYVNVSTKDANGDCGFSNSDDVTVQEPAGSVATSLGLPLIRDGTVGRAVVFWVIESSSATLNDSDVGRMSGQVEFRDGEHQVNLTIDIKPDDIPEIDETFKVKLVNITAPNRLQSGVDEKNVKIIQNDNPGGTFEFQNNSAQVVKEGDTVEATIVRRGSALDERIVGWRVLPSPQTDIDLTSNILVFPMDRRSARIQMYIRSDSVPELDEVFTVELYPANIDGKGGVMGNKTTIRITVTQNDDPHGIFGFGGDLVIHINESQARKEIASFRVDREKGAFGNVDVYWNSTGVNTSTEIAPVLGVLHFRNGETVKTIDIESIADEIPEKNESFSIQLTKVTGEARLGAQTQATLVIDKNDDPVFFSVAAVRVSEGQYANLTIVRGGDGDSVVTVMFSTQDGTAKEGIDYDAKSGQITFGRGIFRQEVSFHVIDDSTPEGVESFSVRLSNVTGNAVLRGTTVVTVTIDSSDDATGVFGFVAGAENKTALEGSPVQFLVSRSTSSFGVVDVHWEVLRMLSSDSMESLSPGQEFTAVTGAVRFEDQVKSNSITLTAKADGIAELNEAFVLQLVNATGINTGEDGKLGSDTRAVFEVVANDDPNGRFLFAESSRSVDIPEDFNPGMQSETERNLTVLRGQGAWGRVEVLWEIFTTSSAAKFPSVYDLLFLGTPHAGVTLAANKRRTNTETYVYRFTSSRNDSYVKVSSAVQVGAELTISAWIQPSKDTYGFVLSKASSSHVFYGLAVNTTAANTVVEFLYRIGSTTHTLKAELGKDLADGSWHNVAVTVGNSQANVYEDGDPSGGERPLNASGSISDGSGMLLVGALRAGEAHLDGYLQDVRIYSSKLEARLVKDMTGAITTLKPINGYLTFQPDVTSQRLAVATVDDNVPEPEQQFAVALLSPKGGAVLDENHARAILSVDKSDNANGLFGFKSVVPITTPESQNITAVVERQKGTEGSVTVRWAIYKGMTSQLATQDFIHSTGTLVFSERESEKTLDIGLTDDTKPELGEVFVVKLLSASPADGKPGSTATSGASLRPDYTAVNITIENSDDPYGLLQFMSGVPPVNETVGLSTGPFSVSVNESDGSVTLHVIRAQGTEGSVTCQWRTVPGSAKSPAHYQDSAGKVSFAPGVRNATIRIIIVDNNIPELEKTFQVELFAPTGGATVGAGGVATVIISPSDDAFGVISFTSDSLSATLDEAAGSQVALNLQRTGGVLGLVKVLWSATGPDVHDLVNYTGYQEFRTGQNHTTLVIKVKDDVIPEPSESYIVRLISVTAGRLAPHHTESNITIRSSDDPFGILQFNPSNLRVSEGNTTLNLTITRTFGTMGTVRVYYSSENITHTGSLTHAVAGDDYEPITGSVDFTEGQKEATVQLRLLDDALPESDELVVVELIKVVLIFYPVIQPVPVNSPRLGHAKLAQVVIEKNDNANGVLQLSASAVTVQEPNTGPILAVTRTEGTFGKVNVFFEVTPITASRSDYQVLAGNVSLAEGQRTAAVPVNVVNDQIPEFSETFTVRLLAANLQGGAKLGSPVECTVTIEENDYPYGLMGFASGSLDRKVVEATAPTKVFLTVERRFGRQDATTVHWEARLNGRLASDDITVYQGDLVFAHNESSKAIEFEVKSDNIPETPEQKPKSPALRVIQFNLTRVTQGKAAIDSATQLANLTIAANDAPHGVFEFVRSSYTVIEDVKSKVTVVYLPIRRRFGTFGDVRVFYSTLPGTAQPNKDYIPLTNASVVIPKGHSEGNITISILNDSIPELGEMFGVKLEYVQLIGPPTGFDPRLGSIERANVTILYNDNAHGLFVILAKTADPGSDGSKVTVAEQENLAVELIINRLGGTIGDVGVRWEVRGGGSATRGQDFTGDGFTFDFRDGQRSKTFSVTIKDDDLPERDETIIIKLVSPTGGAEVARGLGNNVTVVISANDGVGGRVGFAPLSRSVVTKEGELVNLLVNRTSPAAGRVTVDWHVVNGSADFVQGNGTIQFVEGQTSTNVTLQIKSDSKPEVDELFVVELSNIKTFDIAQSGKALLLAEESTATLSVSANDEPHGVVEFQLSSRNVEIEEGNKTLQLTVSRLFGKIGTIHVGYEVMNGSATALAANQQLAEPGRDFVAENGTIEIPDGQSAGVISITILDEDLAELDEVFMANITAVELVSSASLSKVPPRLGQYLTSRILIRANDNPRGALVFAHNRVYLNESTSAYNLTVLRTQGTFGVVRVNYRVFQQTATSADFFVAGADAMTGAEVMIEFADGQREQNITVYVLNDGTPEDDEKFTVFLRLRSDSNGATLGRQNQVDVIISHSDNGRGVFKLDCSSVSKIIVEPGNGNINEAQFQIVRNVASFGTVVVGWRVVNGSASSDLSPVSGNMTFGPSETQKAFSVRAVIDSVPEQAETFVIALSILSGGGTLENPSQALLTIRENDLPYGMFEIISSKTKSSSESVEEDIGVIKALIRRAGGNYGRIYVDYETVPGTAVSPSGDVNHFEVTQRIATIKAKRWHSFSAYGERYLVLASTNRTGRLPSGVGNASADGYKSSTLFRWQGVYVPVQTFATDGAVAWESFSISGVVYLAVANYGTTGRHQTTSRVYKLDSSDKLSVIQDIPTEGAVDVKYFQPPGSSRSFLVIANQKNNGGATYVKSQVYRWDASKFVQVGSGFSTRAASGIATFHMNGKQFMAMSFYQDLDGSFTVKSPVYEWESNEFKTFREVDTNGSIGVQHFYFNGKHYLLFANSKSSAAVNRWDGSAFTPVHSVPTKRLASARVYQHGANVRLLTVEDDNAVRVYEWNSHGEVFQLQMNTSVTNAVSAEPVPIVDSVAGNYTLLAVANSGSTASPVIQPASLAAQADFIPRQGQLIFENGERELELDLTILPDTTPERDESFKVVLLNASGNAVLGSQRELTVSILSNDNAHGRVEFAADSMNKVQPELDTDTVVTFTILREQGTFGRVVVSWNATGNYSTGDISPTSGQAVFSDGVGRADIEITVHKDALPELDEYVYIRLLQLTDTGSSNPNRGAVLNTGKATALLIIPANDDPHGVIEWQKTLVLSQEIFAQTKTVSLMVLRQQGLIGRVSLSYETVQAQSVAHANEKIAQPGVDYVSKKGLVGIAEGENSTTITVDILHDNSTEKNKIFFVNLTSVTLDIGSKSSLSARRSPRISPGRRLVEIGIVTTNLTRGELNFDATAQLNASLNAIVVNESLGSLYLTVVRTGSTAGEIGFHYLVSPFTSGHYAAANAADYSPSSGTVTLADGVTSAVLTINITDDVTPEMQEEFYVYMTKPVNGARIGSRNRINVIIAASDEPHGVFGFWNASEKNNIVHEGYRIRLGVVRRKGTFGEVEVYWTVTPQVHNDISPSNGTLTFGEGVTSGFIELSAVNDSLPEGQEQFTVELVGVTSGGKLDSRTKSVRLYVPANDNAMGVISIATASRNLLVRESQLVVITILRQVGRFGPATVSWSIKKDNIPNTEAARNTFNATSGSVDFVDGQEQLSVDLEVLEDSRPEEKEVFSFDITSVTDADVDVTARSAVITVAASDEPYGVLEFDPPLMRNVSEDGPNVVLTVRRKHGITGRLALNFSVESTTAIAGRDYQLQSTTELFFNNDEASKTITITILQDSEPELSEVITVRLTDVKLIPTRLMNYSVVNGIQIDMPPRIGPESVVNITIVENDDARGIIEFKESAKIASERDGVVVLDLERKGGTLLPVEAVFHVTNGTAHYGQDFNVSGGEVLFASGQRQAKLTIPILDDSIPEQRETFTVRLLSATNGAKLGSKSSVVITIETSDNPQGLFGFVNETSLVLDNPNVTSQFKFGVARIGGAQNQIQDEFVDWRLMRLPPSTGPLSTDFQGSTSGRLTFNADDRATQYIALNVLPYIAEEPEEKYILSIYQVSGSADIADKQANITITVRKRGFPNGVFSFKSTPVQVIDEPDTGKETSLQFTVLRTRGAQGTVPVHWKVTGHTDNGAQDVRPLSDVLVFTPGEFEKNVVVYVKGDDVPELEETYTVTITSVEGGGDLDEAAQNVTFKIRANDNPHGIIKLAAGSVKVSVNSDMSRQLEFKVQRDKGTIGDVIVTYQVTYSSWYPVALQPDTIHVSNGNSEYLRVIPLSIAAFLSVGSRFTVALAAVGYDGSGESTDRVKLASSSTSATAVVPESAANAVFRIDDSFRYVGVDSVNRVPAIVVHREGMYGTATVFWRQGYPPDMLPAGYTAGRLEPTTGSLLFSAAEKNKTFSVTAVPEMVPNKRLVYAAHLDSASSGFAGGANVTSVKEQRLTIIEYSGVIIMAPASRNQVVTEGGQITCTVLRQYSVLGSVRVTYSALGSSKSLEMVGGEYSKTFTVDVPDNEAPQKDNTIFINITGVTGARSPRLGPHLVARVTVRDNDDAKGVLSITAATLVVKEDATSGNTRKVDLEIRRSKGTIGAVTVLVRSVGGGESWDSLASPQSLTNALASRKSYEKPVVGVDYDQLQTNVSFSNQYPVSGAQTARVQLTIRDDSIPEPSEKIFVYLSLPTGGARLATAQDSLQPWAVVTVEGNDDYNGDVGFVAALRNVSVDEDKAPSVELTVERRFRVGSGSSSGSVTVVWRVQEQSMRSQVKSSEGEVTMAAGVTQAVITVELNNDDEPEFQSVLHVALVELKNTSQATLSPNATMATVHVVPSDFPYGLIGFAESSIYTVVNKQSATATLEIVRGQGITTDTTVSYEVRQLGSESSVSGVPTYKALQGQDYVKPSVTSVQFLPGVKTRTITVKLLPESSSSSSYPKAFEIVLLTATNNAALKPSYLRASVIISNDEETTKFLQLRATAKRPVLTDDEINQLLVNLTNIIKSPLNSDRLTLTKDIIESILNSKARRPTPEGKKLQAITRKTMMDIFDELLNPSRTDTKGKDDLSPVFEKFVFSLVNGLPCGANPAEKLEGKYAAVEAYRKEYKDLNGLKIKTRSSKDYFEYPQDLFVVSSQNGGKKECQDIHFIDYKVSHWFNKPQVNAPVKGKVLSTSLNETAAMKSPMNPVTYRVYLNNKRVTPKGARCVYWDANGGDWSTSGCEVKYDESDFVECQCNHMSSFAIQAQTDDRAGYSNYFYAACGVCMAAFALALLAHHACAVENSFVAKLMMHMFFAGLLAHIMLIVGAFTSPSLVQQGELARCSVLGMFLHYFFLCQFSWMFVQGWNLWRILVLNDEHTNRKHILFFILGWGMPVIVVVLYIIVTQAAFNWQYTEMYGDVHGTGDMCFMSNIYAALATNVAPVLLFLMGVAVVFTQAYQVTPQWKYYDDIFRGQYNIKEIRHVIVVFACITLTWLFAGLHLAYGFLWMIIVFSILDILTGMYVFILFFILRNQVRGMFKQSYAVPNVTPPILTQDDFFQDRPSSTEHSINSLKRQRPRHSPESDWEDGDMAVTPGGSRKLLVNMNGHMNDSGSFQGRVNEGYGDEPESQDFDDLIFALKTGGNFNPSPDEEKDLGDFELAPTSEHYQVRRISIADTHI